MLRSVDKWLPGYLASLARRPRHGSSDRHLLLCVADHFEPFRPEGGGLDLARQLVERWVTEYPKACRDTVDSDGRPPRHTFFYPQEDYHPEIIEALAGLARAGLGEVEIHLHHRNDTPAGFRDKLNTFRDQLHREHGLLGCDASGSPRYAFIHGNWALCNSRPDGDHCGVNAEIEILRETGCYADMTYPSAPSPTQPRTVNSIYYAVDRPGGPRGADKGSKARVGITGQEGLLMIQGPLGLNWSRRKWGLLPRLENADVTGANPMTVDRAGLWADTGIHVCGKSDWVFVKLHTHGCDPRNIDLWLGEGIHLARKDILSHLQASGGWNVHFVSAREAANMIHAAEAGCSGNPYDYRDYSIKPPNSAPNT